MLELLALATAAAVYLDARCTDTLRTCILAGCGDDGAAARSGDPREYRGVGRLAAMAVVSEMMQTLIALASLAALIGGVWVVVVLVGRGRRRRDEELWRQWNAVCAYARVAPGDGAGALGQIRNHRQRARRGLKAYVFWQATGDLTAVWFWHRWPPVGAYVVARGSWGAGEHHNEVVFYVHEDELVAVVDRDAPAAWERHERRRQHEAPTAHAPLT